MRSRGILGIGLLLIGLGLLTNSCLKDDSEEWQAAHDEAFEQLKADYNFSESDTIGDGIYLHVLSEGDDVFPEPGDMVIVDLVGHDSKDNVFDITDYETAVSYDVAYDDHIYGPLRMNINNTFPGFFKAIQRMSQGSSAIMLVPHDQAFRNYIPLVYEVKLYRVIKDIDAYNAQQIASYCDSLGIDPGDTLSGFQNVYIKEFTDIEDTLDLELGDILTIRLNAYYVETDMAVVDSFPGRSFFPIGNSSDTVVFEYGPLNFPITELVLIALNGMSVGDKWQIIGPDQYGYGTEGFRHPYTGSFIVPPSMPLQYTIEQKPQQGIY